MNNTKNIFRIVIVFLCFLLFAEFTWLAVMEFLTDYFIYAGLSFISAIGFLVPVTFIFFKWYKAMADARTT